MFFFFFLLFSFSIPYDIVLELTDFFFFFFPRFLFGLSQVPGLYVAGWLKRGPTGVIATTMQDAFETAETIVADFKGKQVTRMIENEPRGYDAIAGKLGGRAVSYSDWKLLERAEEEAGAARGKPREKIARVDEMLKVIEKLKDQRIDR